MSKFNKIIALGGRGPGAACKGIAMESRFGKFSRRRLWTKELGVMDARAGVVETSLDTNVVARASRSLSRQPSHKHQTRLGVLLVD